jgi:hypothetical protein
MRRILLALAAAFIGAGAWIAWLLLTSPVGSLRTSWAHEPGGPETRRVVGLQAAGLPVLSDLPPLLVLSVLVSEDHRFATHGGIDRREVLDALQRSLLAGAPLRGASTITQQLARSAFLSGERRLSRKLLEALYALQLERAYSKSEILSLYLQILRWGPELYGLTQASRAYFGKEPAQLTLEDSIVLVSFLPDPVTRGSAFLQGARDDILSRAVIRRTVKMHQVLWWLERSEIRVPLTGDAILGLPLAESVAAEVTPADWEAIVARVGPSLDRIPAYGPADNPPAPSSPGVLP